GGARGLDRDAATARRAGGDRERCRGRADAEDATGRDLPRALGYEEAHVTPAALQLSHHHNRRLAVRVVARTNIRRLEVEMFVKRLRSAIRLPNFQRDRADAVVAREFETPIHQSV